MKFAVAAAVIGLVLRGMIVFQNPARTPTPPTLSSLHLEWNSESIASQTTQVVTSRSSESKPPNTHKSKPNWVERKNTEEVSNTTTTTNNNNIVRDSQQEQNEPIILREPVPVPNNNSQIHPQHKQQETTLPIIASKDDPDSFSACLMVYDDNHFLIEWIAYHYHVLPLRRLIIYADPKSRTTPQPILDRWSDRIQITFYQEDDVFPGGFPQKFGDPLTAHRRRQPRFQKACMRQLKREGRGWVLFVDVDEYATIHHDRLLLRDNHKTNNTTNNTLYRLYPLQHFAASNNSLTIPPQQEPGSVLKFLRQGLPAYIRNTPVRYTHPCITLSRKHFGTADPDEMIMETANHSIIGNNNDKDKNNKETASQPIDTLFWNRTLFQTLHWRFWGLRYERPRPGKSMIDFAQLTMEDIHRGKTDVHRPIPNNTICKRRAIYTPPQDNLFVLHHYQGTLEQLLFRQADARAGKGGNGTAYRVQRFQQAKNYSSHQESADATIGLWLQGFVASVGMDEAKRLLQHVGQPHQAAAAAAAAGALFLPTPPPSDTDDNNNDLL